MQTLDFPVWAERCFLNAHIFSTAWCREVGSSCAILGVQGRNSVCSQRGATCQRTGTEAGGVSVCHRLVVCRPQLKDFAGKK